MKLNQVVASAVFIAPENGIITGALTPRVQTGDDLALQVYDQVTQKAGPQVDVGAYPQ
jgi:hypothetical protein